MRSFEYQIIEGGNPSFGHAQGHKDDHVYSLAWAIYALRDIELPAYEISGISCRTKGIGPEVRFLLGGSLVPFCSSECQSYHQVAELYKQHRERYPDSGVNIEKFYQEKVKNVGGVVYRW
jgi:hypothetical protein